MTRGRGRGWFGDKRRHRLAALKGKIRPLKLNDISRGRRTTLKERDHIIYRKLAGVKEIMDATDMSEEDKEKELLKYEMHLRKIYGWR